MMKPIEVYVKEGETIPESLTNSVGKILDEISGLNSVNCSSRPNVKPLGACPFCHRLLMLLSLKKHLFQVQRIQDQLKSGAIANSSSAGDDQISDGNLDYDINNNNNSSVSVNKSELDFDFVVHKINVTKPPSEFRDQCLRHVPALIDPNTEWSSDHEGDIMDYLDSQYPMEELNPTPANTPDIDRVERICAEMFKKFSYFIKHPNKDGVQLMTSLQALDHYLQNSGTEFIFGSTITTFDIELLPKLHQIRIATNYIRSFQIPPEFSGLWHYLGRAYHCPAFVGWCPSDQEIILNWTAKAANETPTMRLNFEEKKKLTKSEPCFTFTTTATITTSD